MDMCVLYLHAGNCIFILALGLKVHYEREDHAPSISCLLFQQPGGHSCVYTCVYSTVLVRLCVRRWI